MGSLWKLLRHVDELKAYYIAIAVISVLLAVTALASPFLLQGATDHVVKRIQGQPSPVSTVIWFAAAILAAEVINALLSNIGGYLGDVMSMRMRAILSSRYYSKLLRLPQSYFDNNLSGAIIARLTRSISELSNFMQMVSNNFLPMIVTLVAALAVTGFYYWPLTVLLVLIFPVYTWLTALTSERWQRYEKAKNEHVDIAGGMFAEVISQMRVVKSFVAQRRELDRFNDEYTETIALTRPQSKWWHQMDGIRRTVLAVIFFGINAMILVQTMNGRFSLGTMVLLIQLVGMAKGPVTGMSFLVDSTQRALAGSRDYFSVLDEQDEPGASLDPVSPTQQLPAPVPGAAAVEFRDVGFGYDQEPNVLDNITFTVQPGERIALVGESGGGKTTIVNLLMGLFPPRSGSIELFGKPHTAHGLDTLRREVGVVFQDASLFSGTIEANIKYGAPWATDEQVRQAAVRANAAEFVEKFADGYQTVIGERGLKLSGGQKQRIAVARAMLKDAPVLVLDEATSALDTKSERLVQAGLEELMVDRTSIIIAHRLSTIATVDRIITIEDGRIDEIGTPAELAASGGIYAQLLSLQESGSKQDRKRLQSYDILR
ncbi:ABC transporter ATP-binding protein [Propionibacteriaceae bacterium G57]|uniref:ABC transporter ATP-binding protein n=1 Tax=Aestuariimicrobium sp. G57 TaxID=3418485 RepID=UPI003DA74E6E